MDPQRDQTRRERRAAGAIAEAPHAAKAAGIVAFKRFNFFSVLGGCEPLQFLEPI